MTVLSADETDRELAERGLAWRREHDELVKEAELRNFAGALDYVNRVGELAEQADHHPDIDIRWNRVTLRLSTHSERGITAQDLDLAEEIDRLGAGG